MIDVKRDMMRLWKETFHDSDRYIQLVFDAYFDLDNICVRYDGDRLTAALLGVPYGFLIPREWTFAESPTEALRLNGLYLCGLATRPDYRKQGIMSELMGEIQANAAQRNFDFTFLIPADDHLREYYRQRGYRDFSRRMDYKIGAADSPGCFASKLAAGEWTPHSIKNIFRNGETGLVRKLAEWCVGREADTLMPTLLHSVDDMVAVMDENENAIFFTDCASGREYENLANLVAVAFPDEISVEASDEMLKSDPCIPLSWSYRKIFTSSEVEVDTFSSVDLGPYAMARPLNQNASSELRSPDSFSVSLLLD